MKIYIGTDHAGYVLKEKLVSCLKADGYEVVDMGAFEYNEGDDYPDFVIPVARAVSKDPDGSKGIILGGTGEGEAIAANKFPHVRAIVDYGKACPIVDDEADIITRSRQHNNANILSLGARYFTEEDMMEAVKNWLNTAFSGDERHIRRLAKIDAIPVVEQSSLRDK
ncbi:RpiB/LacA/LacB family sugar-phosphate isomerase [Candidatus Nomurabacteria bacterium]|nr:RpiB/LacA/LacB family sugar-phosphate isomerase [Candidatus Nomurabacteria bacterium]